MVTTNDMFMLKQISISQAKTAARYWTVRTDDISLVLLSRSKRWGFFNSRKNTVEVAPKASAMLSPCE